jgi:hypothetical protein
MTAIRGQLSLTDAWLEDLYEGIADEKNVRIIHCTWRLTVYRQFKSVQTEMMCTRLTPGKWR